jgi:hypothetical protein
VSSDFDALEMQERYNFLIEKSVALSREISAKLEEFGRYRKEIIFILEQFKNNNANLEEPQRVVDEHQKDIEEELERLSGANK